MKLYLIRHGESETNLSGCWTGWMDVALTERGIADAKRAGKLIRDVAFDKIFSSDLQRARKTAETALPEQPYEVTPLLREINVGNIAGKPLSVVSDEMKQTTHQLGYADFGGETREEFCRRVHDFMKLAEALDCQNVAAFAHAGWLRTMLDEVVGAILPRSKVLCNNCAVAIFDYTNGAWRLHSWINLP